MLGVSHSCPHFPLESLHGSVILPSSKGALHGHHLLLKMRGSVLLAFPRQSISLWLSDNLLLRVLVVWSYRGELCFGSHRQTVPGKALAAPPEASALFLEKRHYKSRVLAAPYSGKSSYAEASDTHCPQKDRGGMFTSLRDYCLKTDCKLAKRLSTPSDLYSFPEEDSSSLESPS